MEDRSDGFSDRQILCRSGLPREAAKKEREGSDTIQIRYRYDARVGRAREAQRTSAAAEPASGAGGLQEPRKWNLPWPGTMQVVFSMAGNGPGFSGGEGCCATC